MLRVDSLHLVQGVTAERVHLVHFVALLPEPPEVVTKDVGPSPVRLRDVEAAIGGVVGRRVVHRLLGVGGAQRPRPSATGRGPPIPGRRRGAMPAMRRLARRSPTGSRDGSKPIRRCTASCTGDQTADASARFDSSNASVERRLDRTAPATATTIAKPANTSAMISIGGSCQSGRRTAGVHEGPRQVDSATARLQHPLNRLVDLLPTKHQVGPLVPNVAGREHPRGPETSSSPVANEPNPHLHGCGG